MNKLSLSLRNCYGIASLVQTLDFSGGKNVAVYASNGTMKSSLARVFRDIKKGEKPRDRIFKDADSECAVLCDGDPIQSDSIMVFDPDEVVNEVETSAGILVNADLRDKYNATIKKMEGDMERLVRRLNKLSKVTKGEIRTTILADFERDGAADAQIYEVLSEHAGRDPPNMSRFDGIFYSQLFNNDTQKLYEAADFQKRLEAYIDRYDRLVDLSRFLNGRFDHHAALGVQKELDKSGFFDAKHTVVMNPKQKQKHCGTPEKIHDPEEIHDPKSLKDVIDAEKNTIEKELDSEWEEMDKIMARTQKLAQLRLLLAEHRWLLPLLANISDLKRQVWMTCFAKERGIISDICEQYSLDKAHLDGILQAARSEKPRWTDIVKEFKRRFYVPFDVEVTNQEEALLDTQVPALKFTYDDKRRRTTVEREALKTVLSNGEKRALYILNMLFEVEKQMQKALVDSTLETVVVIDDLVDSFDYKNKYAIVHYLKEVVDRPDFHMIVLTHNFDFLRTIKGRGIIDGKQIYFVQKRGEKTSLISDKLRDNPLDGFVARLNDPLNLIASIPFARNIIEYTRGTSDPDYLKLTQMLHWRDGTDKIDVGELLDVLARTFSGEKMQAECAHKREDTIFDMIVCAADECSKARRENTLEEKIVLSIAIRLLAERLLVRKLRSGDAPAIADRITIHGWIRERRLSLEDRAKRDGRSLTKDESAELEALDEVALMTPEIIHINSFMYEPILDMPSDGMRSLYSKMLDLGGEACGA